MRLRRLALTRYGKFTDHTIDFGEAVQGEPDLHIVYGPNEAGKSTAFAAFLDLLFGIEMQSRYSFLHPYDTMRIGGCLELSVGPRELVRIKRPQPTLRDGSDQPVAEGLIRGDLGGLDRASYRTMFSLDDETLEAGGNSILASNGELGQLLFSASAGLAELSRTLLELRSKTDGFTWRNARSGELHQLKAGLEILKQERASVDTLASHYNRLAEERKEAAKRYEGGLAEHSRVQADLARVRRTLAALPRRSTLRGLKERLQKFAGLPVAPPGWLNELPDLERAENSHRSGIERARTEVVRLSGVIEAVDVDSNALALAGGLDQLTLLTARSLTAELDLPLRERELALVDGKVRSMLQRLGREGETEPGRLQLTAAQSTAFDQLMQSRSGIEARLTTARAELAEAVFDAAEATQVMDAQLAVPLPGSLGPVVSALHALRESDHPLRLRNGERARDRSRETLIVRMAALAPWIGDVEELAVLVLPDLGMIEAWRAEAEQDAMMVGRRRDDVDRLGGELAARRSELDAIATVGGLVSDQDAAKIRSAREAAWAEHRRALDAVTAEAFEVALRRDDLVSGMRLGHERELAKLHETAQAVAIKQAELERARTSLADTLTSQNRRSALFTQAVASIGPDLAGFSPDRLLVWMGKRDDALECRQQIREAEGDLREAEVDAAGLLDRLTGAIAHAGLPVDPLATLDAVVMAAQAAVDRELQVEGVRQKVVDRQRIVRKREAALRQASTADEAWSTAWQDACSDTWIGEAAASSSIDTVRGLLTAAAELATAVGERAKLCFLICGMKHDQVVFRSELKRLIEALGIGGEGQAEHDLAGAVSDRVQEAGRAADERRRLQEELVKAEDHERDVQQAALEHTRRLDEMMRVLGVASLINMAEKLRDANEKADLERQADLAEREVLAALQVETLAEADVLLEGQGLPELEAEEAGLSAQLGDLEVRTRELFAASKETIDRLDAVGGDDAAARLEEQRRTLLLEIEDKAQHYLRLRLGIAAADRALRLYRDQHRSSMMREASKAFSLISRGAYRGLGTQPSKDGDILVALAADGGSKLAGDLSKGTRFQLYLALRAAGYHEFAKLRPPVPFIADDIMETFDDFRAEETLKVLGEMSRLGQVIYLTHHDHLRDLAQRTVAGVRVHGLAT